MFNCIVKVTKGNYTDEISKVKLKLSEGWVVKIATPYIKEGGVTDFVVYILEKRSHNEQ